MDVRWGGVNLANVSWYYERYALRQRRVRAVVLGEENDALAPIGAGGKSKSQQFRLFEWEAAVRANRQLAAELRSQGLHDDSDEFALRADSLQRHVLAYRRQWGAYAFSLGLFALAGYGYRMWRLVLTYAGVVGLFMCLYFLYFLLRQDCQAPSLIDALVNGTTCGPTHGFSLWESAVFSVTALHGRVFSSQYGPSTLIGVLAALEAILGVVLEGVFIALLTQRYFGR